MPEHAPLYESVESAPQHHQRPLLESKFHPPRLHASLIERKRLLGRLAAIREHRLTLLCAPAGFGKTTAINQWIEHNRVRGMARPVAWVSLEKSDNDPLRFWRYVITACQTLHDGLGSTSLAQLAAERLPFEIPSLEMVLTLLLNDIARLADDDCLDSFLIIEDYHAITHPLIHETMAFFLDHLPAQLHVVTLSRSEPPLPLARWRARGDLYEIHAADLRFSREEVAQFFQQVLALPPSTLPTEALDQIETHLEGWAAGLRLLALTLQGNANQRKIEPLLAFFAGNQRSLQDYFASEVLGIQPESRQDFLLRTSILSHLTGSLCDAITERDDSNRLLEEIERAGLFLESLDKAGGWYRYHALFAEAMQAEARRRLGENALYTYTIKASQWYERHGMLAEAIETAFQAQDTTRAADLIERILAKVKHFLLGPPIFQEINGFHTLRRWLEQLPETTFRGRPLLYMGYATALLLVFVVDQRLPSQELITKGADQLVSYQALFMKIEQVLKAVEEEYRKAGDLPKLGGALAFRALIIRERGDIRDAITYAEQALTYLPEDDQEWRSLCLNVIGMGKLLDGQIEQAQTIFLKLCALCETFGNRAILRANTAILNIISYEQGKLHQAAEFFRHMLNEARAERDYDDIAHASLLLAWLSYEWNDLQASEQYAQETLDLGRQIGNEEFQVRAALVLARIEHVRGHTAQAQQRCTSLLARLPATSPLRYRLCREIQMTLAHLSLALGDLSAVERWRNDTPLDATLPINLREREELLVARWLIAKGEAAEALSILTRLYNDTQQMGRTRNALEVLAVMVLGQHSCEHVQEARQTLQTLLTRARTEGYLRLFLDEGETMITLLRIVIPQLRERSLVAYAQTILSAATSHHTKPSASSTPAYAMLTEPLSLQEQRVLRLLISGHSNSEIAKELVVSINTVKSHLKNIYRKLDVRNRLEACEAARLLDFL
jgi:LuxR family transcriptional regulator, maltose regulon positive regulatory protein